LDRSGGCRSAPRHTHHRSEADRLPEPNADKNSDENDDCEKTILTGSIDECYPANTRDPETSLISHPSSIQLNWEEIEMAEENGGGAGVASNFVWAIALILIVMIVMGALYYGGILSGKKKTEVDVNVSVPAR